LSVTDALVKRLKTILTVLDHEYLAPFFAGITFGAGTVQFFSLKDVIQLLLSALNSYIAANKDSENWFYTEEIKSTIDYVLTQLTKHVPDVSSKVYTGSEWIIKLFGAAPPQFQPTQQQPSFFSTPTQPTSWGMGWGTSSNPQYQPSFFPTPSSQPSQQPSFFPTPPSQPTTSSPCDVAYLSSECMKYLVNNAQVATSDATVSIYNFGKDVVAGVAVMSGFTGMSVMAVGKCFCTTRHSIGSAGDGFTNN
jgi:hypothetical protein